MGQFVLSQAHVSKQEKIQVPNHLSPGVYILRLRREGYASEQKLTKAN